jgi:hypothetical protein
VLRERDAIERESGDAVAERGSRSESSTDDMVAGDELNDANGDR